MISEDWADPAGMPTEPPVEAILVEPPPLPAPEKKPFPGIGGAILLSLLLLAIQLIAGIAIAVVLMLIGGVRAAQAGPGMAVVTILAVIAAFAGVMLVGLALAKRPFSEVCPLKSFRWLLLLPLVIAVEGIGILVSELDNLTRFVLPMPDFIAEWASELVDPGLLPFIAVVIVAPVTEELIFRGLILRGLLKRYGFATAVLVSTGLFTLVHVNPYQFGCAFLMGLFLAWLFVRTRSLWPCIIAHALFNLHPFVLPYLPEWLGFHIRGFTSLPGKGAVEFQPAWFNVLGLVLVGAGLCGVLLVQRGAGSRSDTNSPACGVAGPSDAVQRPGRSS